MRVNYRNLPQGIKQARARPKPRLPNGAAPQQTVGSVMSKARPGGLAGLANAARQKPNTIATPQRGSMGRQTNAGSAIVGAAMGQVPAAPVVAQQPAAGRPSSPVAPVNQILQPGAETGGTVGKSMRGRARVGGGGFRSRRR